MNDNSPASDPIERYRRWVKNNNARIRFEAGLPEDDREFDTVAAGERMAAAAREEEQTRANKSATESVKQFGRFMKSLMGE